MTSALDAALLEAHEARDLPALIGLYTEAAEGAASETGRGFYLTHAYVFALECGDARAADLRKRLAGMGRETAA